jgi:hypothetical protein
MQAPMAAASGRRIALELTSAKKIAMIVLGVFAPLTFGLTLLVILWVLYIEPVAVDEEGISPRWGSKLLWKDLTGVTHVRLMRYGRPVGFRIELKFRNGSSQINSFSFPNATEAVRLVESCTGRRILSV